MIRIVFNLIFLLGFISCNNKMDTTKTLENVVIDTIKTNDNSASAEIINNVINSEIKLKITRRISKDPLGYTQGLFVDDGFLYESTGQHGSSSLRKIELPSGKILKKYDISAQYFGEGSAVKGNKIYWLTWQNGICFVYDKSTFKQLELFDYPGEGWGLTNSSDGNFFLSDGSSFLRLVNSENFNFTGSIQILDGFRPIEKLNELEFVNGEIWANIWQTDIIVRIDPISGKVLQKMDLSFLRNELINNPTAEVLNGIAYDKQSGKYYISGKYWNSYFEMEIEKNK